MPTHWRQPPVWWMHLHKMAGDLPVSGDLAVTVP